MVPVPGPLRVIIAGLVLGGCATETKQCDKPVQSTLSNDKVTISAPEGCWFTDDGNSLVRTITCVDGRQGIAIANVPNTPVEAGE